MEQLVGQVGGGKEGKLFVPWRPVEVLDHTDRAGLFLTYGGGARGESRLVT